MAAKARPAKVRCAVIGGSGVYQIDGMKVLSEYYPTTPFGKPSDPITIGSYQGVKCAFLPRHGKGHRFLPGEIPQRANFYALKQLGVEFVIALSACGSLKEELPPRHFVIPDQIIDYTSGRKGTFFEGNGSAVTHVDFTEPYDHELRRRIAEAGAALGIAMGNAIPAVRERADRSTTSNDDDGVAFAIGKILAGEW
jgi:5'-methylthioadenosine phosphorylase